MSFGHGDERERVHEVHDLARRALALGFDADREARRIDEHQDRNVVGVAQHEKAHDLVARVGIERAAFIERIVGDEADRLAVEPRKRGDGGFAEARFQLEVAFLVDDALQDFAHVVDLRARLGKHAQDVANRVAEPAGTGHTGGASLLLPGR